MEPEQIVRVQRPTVSQEDRVEVESLPDSDDECLDAEPERMNAEPDHDR